MKPAVCLTDPAETRRVRLDQPRVSSAQFRAQLLAMRHAQTSLASLRLCGKLPP